MISFVFFDLGGTVMLDFSKTNKWNEFKKEIGITAVIDAEFERLWNKFEIKVNTGLDVETLTPLLKQKFGIQIPKEYSVLINGFVDRFEVNKSIWPVIEEIQKHCRVGLLTNMYPGMFEAIKKREIIPDVNWDIIIDSSVEKMAKPDPMIYQLAEDWAGVSGNKILFVENTQGNINAAQKLGWQTFLYDPAHPESSSNNLLAFFHLAPKQRPKYSERVTSPLR